MADVAKKIFFSKKYNLNVTIEFRHQNILIVLEKRDNYNFFLPEKKASNEKQHKP